VQRFKCHACGKQFIGGERIDNQVLWQEYTQGKQTYQQLSKKYCTSIKTIQRHLDKVSIKLQYHKVKESIILMDTTFRAQFWCYGIQKYRGPTIVLEICEV
jgi:hypothetical protein